MLIQRSGTVGPLTMRLMEASGRPILSRESISRPTMTAIPSTTIGLRGAAKKREYLAANHRNVSRPDEDYQRTIAHLDTDFRQAVAHQAMIIQTAPVHRDTIRPMSIVHQATIPQMTTAHQDVGHQAAISHLQEHRLKNTRREGGPGLPSDCIAGFLGELRG